MKASSVKIQSAPVVASIMSAGTTASMHASESWRVTGPSFPNAQALLRGGTTVDAVLLHATDAAQAFAWLKELRGSAEFALTPMFCTQVFDEAVSALVDEVLEHATHLSERVAAILERQLALPSRANMDEQDRLLAFLYTRELREIRPLCDWRSEHIYRYPLLEVFAPAGITPEEWLQSLRRRLLLEPVELVDRVRQCSSCAGVHLNYVDVCPQCEAIDIRDSIFLHCHTCGHVDIQSAFVPGHGLGCPKCQARLRHIGVDYDRALEAFSCNACNGRFTEPEVKAHCYQCRKVANTETLLEKRVESYRLSEAGQLAARTGRVGELFALIDDTNCVHPAYFEQTLEFLLNLSRRHKEIEFGLVCLRFANVRELLLQMPRVQVSQMIDGFALRLRELVRTTDMVMRSDDEHCWLLLPQTPEAGLKVLTSRVSQIPQLLQASPVRLALSIASISSTSLPEQRPEAVLLMAELGSQVS
jgi:hypothetical protein